MNETTFQYEVDFDNFTYQVDGDCWCKFTRDEDGVYMEYYDFTSSILKIDQYENEVEICFGDMPKCVQNMVDNFVQSVLEKS